MDNFISLIADIIGWITGKKANEAIDRGEKKKAFIFGTAFLLVVVAMAAYSIYWLAKNLGH